MESLSDDKEAASIQTFNFTTRYLDDFLNFDSPFLVCIVGQIYPPELQLDKTSSSDTKASFLNSHLSVSNGFVSSIINDKLDDFDSEIIKFPFLDGDSTLSTSHRFFISQLIRFARMFGHVTDFNARNTILIAKLLQQGYRYNKL